ncbi:site-specific DNA-methyltransferase [Falsiroseomonas sp. CW058]|uniref:site-specific DNA-methyltransferase n=1 Tax=Falsiroseomonas sp. CW058 TaxID=3388664 RepID=UPI003D312431
MEQSGRYNHLSREQLIELLERRDVRRNFGLVWEREGIEPDRAMNTDFVALELDPELSTAPLDERGWRNLVIEGDNWDALRALRIAYAGRVNCIFIDPPYNTGNADFSYNDKFIGANDRYRQSLWIEFLYRRLMVARDLLAQDGVIFVCINDENRARLDLLMEKVFPGMRLGSFVWRTRTAVGDAKPGSISIDHEHVLAYGNNGARFSGVPKTNAAYKKGKDGEVSQSVTLTQSKNYRKRPNSYFPLVNPSNEIHYPCNPDRVWAFVEKIEDTKGGKGRTASEIIAADEVIWPENDRFEVFPTLDALEKAIFDRAVPHSGRGKRKKPLLRPGLPGVELLVGKKIGWGTPRRRVTPKSVRSEMQPTPSIIIGTSEAAKRASLRSGTNGEGTAELRGIFEEDLFSYPKPRSLVSSLISQVTPRDGLILDFFAGSGTTGHAVLSLNSADLGDRRFVLVSNSEKLPEDPSKTICRDVCAERLRRVIKGYGTAPPMKGDFAYLRTQRMNWDDVLYDLDDGALWTLLQLRHDRPVRPFDPAAPVQIAHPDPRHPADPIIAFLPRVTEEAVAQLRQLAVLGSLVAFSPAPALLRDALDMPAVPVEQVPDRLLAEFPQLIAGL